MIISENIKLNITLPLDNDLIETKLAEMGITPLRWAIVSVNGQEICVNVSYVKEN